MILEKIESIQDVAILYLLNYRKVRIDREKRRKLEKKNMKGYATSSPPPLTL